jgi:hypothetical protein
MTRPLRYGVFSLGQIWKICSEDGVMMGFADRAQAVSNARSLCRKAIADGVDVELLIQDERGAVMRDRLSALGH